VANTRKEALFSSTANSDGHSPRQPYSRQVGHYRRSRVDRLVHSVTVLDEWLKQNEGKIADEMRVRRMKRWRGEALQQLRLELNRTTRAVCE
jgi:hypothetical protein